jgi:hypothetical protein
MEIPAQSIPTAYFRSSVFKRGIKTHEFVNKKNEISDFPSADKVRRHRKHVLIFIKRTWHVLHVQKGVLQHFLISKRLIEQDL